MWKAFKWAFGTAWALLLTLALFIFQKWISREEIPNLPPIISFLSHKVFVLICALVILGILAGIAFWRDALERLRKKVWFFTPARLIRPSDVNRSPAWFDPYFLKRPSVATTVNLLLSGKGVLLSGVPLAGKTRCAFEVLKQLRGYHVLGLFPDEETIADIAIPRSFFFSKPKIILLLDDLERYVDKFLPLQLYQRIAKQSASVTFLATCRSGNELASVKKDRDWGSLVRQYMTEVTVDPLSKDEERTLATHFNRDWNELAYNGTPGSIVFGLEEMQQRLSAASLDAKILMRSLNLMRQAGLLALRRSLAEEIAATVYGLGRNRASSEDAWRWLSEAGYIGVQGETAVPTHLVYIESSFLGQIGVADYAVDMAVWQILLEHGQPMEVYCAALGWLQRNEFRLAEIGFRKYLGHDPASSVAHHNLAAMLGAQGRLEEAREECLLAIRFQPNDADAYYNLGWILEQLDRLQEAKRAYGQAIRLNPTSPDAYTNLSELLGNEGQLSEAENLLRDAIRLNPKSSALHINLAVVLRQQCRTSEAIQELREAVRLDPGDADAHFNLAALLGETGDLAQSEREFREAVRHEPHNARIRRGLAWNLHKQGRIHAAVAEQQEAIRCDPADAETHYGLGVMLGEQQRMEEAEDEYRKAIVCEPSHAESHYNLAIALESKGDMIKAEQTYRDALNHKPDHSGARLRLGSLLNKLDKEQEAETEYREGIARDPNFASFHHNLGLLLYEQDRNEEAEREFREAIRANPVHVNAHRGLISVLREEGRIDEAEELEREVKRLLAQSK